MIVNLTPHTVNLVVGEKVTAIKPSGTVARVNIKAVPQPSLFLDDGTEFPVYSTELMEVENLPPPVQGTAFIVSQIVAQKMPHRDDLFFPNEIVRNNGGAPVGCRSLGVHAK